MNLEYTMKTSNQLELLRVIVKLNSARVIVKLTSMRVIESYCEAKLSGGCRFGNGGHRPCTRQISESY